MGGDTRFHLPSLHPPPPSPDCSQPHQSPVGSFELWLVAEFTLLVYELTGLPWLPAQPQAARLVRDCIRANVQGLQHGRLQFHCRRWGCQLSLPTGEGSGLAPLPSPAPPSFPLSPFLPSISSSFFCSVFLDTEPYYLTLASFELTVILLPHPLKCPVCMSWKKKMPSNNFLLQELTPGPGLVTQAYNPGT